MDEAVPKVDGRTLRFAHRRQELLSGATRYAIEHGVTDLSMRKLAAALGISHTALAHHFGSKEALVFEIFEQLAKASVSAQRSFAKRTSTEPADGFDGFVAWWRAVSSPEAQPGLRVAIEVLGLAVRDPERYADFVNEPSRRWIKVLAPVLRANHCPESEIEGTATVLMSFLTGLQVALLVADDRPRVDAAFESFLRMLDARRAEWAVAAGATAHRSA